MDLFEQSYIGVASAHSTRYNEDTCSVATIGCMLML